MKTSKRHAARQQGFMLIEIMVAILFLGIALAGLGPLAMATLRGMDRAQRVTMATELARDKIEDIRNADYASVTNGTDALTQNNTGATWARSWTAEAGPTAGTKLVTVTVHPAVGGIRPVTIRTILAK